MFKLEKIKNHNIYYFKYDKAQYLSWAFIRIQEFYESPNLLIRGCFNTIDDIIKSELDDTGEFTFFEDWGGFNIPGHIWNYFFCKYRNCLRDVEVKMQKELSKLDTGCDFYVIGSSKDEPSSTFEHEIRHGLWYLYDDYRRDMLKVLKVHPVKQLRKQLLGMGYCKEVINDEVQAYVLAGLDESMKMTKEIKNLKVDLKKIEKRFWN